MTSTLQTARGSVMSANPGRTRERHLRAGQRLAELLRLMREHRKRTGSFRVARSANRDKAWAMIPAADVEIPRSWLRNWERLGWVALEFDGEGGHLCTILPEFDAKKVCA